jgi:hypothetical protein
VPRVRGWGNHRFDHLVVVDALASLLRALGLPITGQVQRAEGGPGTTPALPLIAGGPASDRTWTAVLSTEVLLSPYRCTGHDFNVIVAFPDLPDGLRHHGLHAERWEHQWERYFPARPGGAPGLRVRVTPRPGSAFAPLVA